MQFNTKDSEVPNKQEDKTSSSTSLK
jgi:hypothetical protein